MRTLTFAVCLIALAGVGCGGSSSGGSDAEAGAGAAGKAGTGGAAGAAGKAGAAGAPGAGGGGGSAGNVTFSCYETGELCTQILVLPSEVSAEQTTCAGSLESGTSGTGCPTAGLLGCCLPPATDPSHEEQCFYDASSLSIDMQLCSGMAGHTWSTTM